jgi:hypothetical protein
MVQEVFAQSESTITGIVDKINNEILQPLIILLFVIATIAFFWGLITYLIGGGGDVKKIEAGRTVMVWGIAALLLMSSAWGVVRVLCNFFGSCAGIRFP